jgi:hypothetical protein
VKSLKLSEKQLEVISAVAVEKALAYLEKEKEKQEKMKKDRRLRNIKLLLRNYRSFVKHCEGIKLDIKQLNNKLNIDEIDDEYFAIESIKRSKERTLAMVKFINQMLDVYQIMCDRSGKQEEMRHYQTIYQMYISEVRVSHEKIAEGHNVIPRTVYKDVDRACESLAALIFGVDSIRFTD